MNTSALFLIFLFSVLASSVFSQTSTRCGTTWSDANGKCGSLCTNDGGCGVTGERCYADLDTAPCSQPSNPTSPPPSTTPPTAPPTTPSTACGTLVTHSQLQSIMGRPTSDLSRFVTPLNTALAKYGMDCPNRIAAFLAQVRHETAGLTVFHQPRDNGAGSLHMIPQNWGHVCRAIPEIRQLFSEKFSNCRNCECTQTMQSEPMGTMATRAALEVFSDPLAIFLSGAWWFAEGAKTPEIFGWKGCGDLRVDSDNGIGGAGSSDCRHTGFYQITCCVFWTINGEAGLQQRLEFYNLANQVMRGTSQANGDDSLGFFAGAFASDDNPRTFYATTPVIDLSVGQIVGIVVGCVCVVVVVAVAVVVYNTRNSNKEEPRIVQKY